MDKVTKYEVLDLLRAGLLSQSGTASIRYSVDGKAMMAVKAPVYDYGNGESVEQVFAHSIEKCAGLEFVGFWFPKEDVFAIGAPTSCGTSFIPRRPWIADCSKTVREGVAALAKDVEKSLKEAFPTMEAIHAAYPNGIDSFSLAWDDDGKKYAREHALREMLGDASVVNQYALSVDDVLGTGELAAYSIVKTPSVRKALCERVLEDKNEKACLVVELWRTYAAEKAEKTIMESPTAREKTLLGINSVIHDKTLAGAKTFRVIFRRGGRDVGASVKSIGLRSLWESCIQPFYVKLDGGIALRGAARPVDIVVLKYRGKVLFQQDPAAV